MGLSRWVEIELVRPRSERFASLRPKKMVEHYNPDPDILSAMENRNLTNLFRTSGLQEFISLYAIVSLPTEEVIERLCHYKYDEGMTEAQFKAAKEIRMEGKNLCAV